MTAPIRLSDYRQAQELRRALASHYGVELAGDVVILTVPGGHRLELTLAGARWLASILSEFADLAEGRSDG